MNRWQRGIESEDDLNSLSIVLVQVYHLKDGGQLWTAAKILERKP